MQGCQRFCPYFHLSTLIPSHSLLKADFELSTMIRSGQRDELVARLPGVCAELVAKPRVAHDDSIARPIKDILNKPIGATMRQRLVQTATFDWINVTTSAFGPEQQEARCLQGSATESACPITRNR